MDRVILHNPVAHEAARRASNGGLPPLSGSVLGVMANRNANGVALLEALADGLAEQDGVVRGSTVQFELNRPNNDLLDDLAARNDWVLVGAAD